MGRLEWRDRWTASLHKPCSSAKNKHYKAKQLPKVHFSEAPGQSDSGQSRWRGSGGVSLLKGRAQGAMISGRVTAIPRGDCKIPPGSISRMKCWKSYSYRANTPSNVIQNHFTWFCWPWARENKDTFLSRPLTCITFKHKILFVPPDSCLAKFSRGSLLSSLSIILYFFKLFCCCYKTIRLTDSQLSSEKWKDRKQRSFKSSSGSGLTHLSTAQWCTKHRNILLKR